MLVAFCTAILTRDFRQEYIFRRTLIDMHDRQVPVEGQRFAEIKLWEQFDTFFTETMPQMNYMNAEAKSQFEERGYLLLGSGSIRTIHGDTRKCRDSIVKLIEHISQFEDCLHNTKSKNEPITLLDGTVIEFWTGESAFSFFTRVDGRGLAKFYPNSGYVYELDNGKSLEEARETMA
jgi:hypothetical protein